MSTIYRVFAVAILILGLSVPCAAYAHTTGASWEVVSGAYIVDVGYDTSIFTTDSPARFDFKLWQGPGTTTPAGFDQVWVRMLFGSSTILATGLISQPVGPTTLLYQFGQPGAYTLSVSFRDKNGDEIATAGIPVTVDTAAQKDAGAIQWPLLVLGILIGAGALFAKRFFR